MSRSLIIFSILVCIAYGACKKVSGPANGKSVQPNNNVDSLVAMSATINGADWQTDSAFGYKVKSAVNDSNAINLLINAVRKDNGKPSTIELIISNYKGLARYVINPPAVTASYYVGNTRHYATYGNITVTSNSIYGLIGTFYFTADSLAVNGSFNVAMP